MTSSVHAVVSARAAVAQAWRIVAGASSLAADQPIEAAGVFSRRRLRVVFHLEAALGRSLPVDAFRQALRPSEFVAVLDRLAAARSVPALFLFPGTGGDDPALLRLRASLPATIDVAVMQFPDWPEDDPQVLGFAGLLDAMVTQIQTRAPEGPLRLAGYSLGGHLAYATGLRLQALGRTVARLGIIDSTWSAVPRWAPLWSPGRAVRFVDALRQGEGLPSAGNFVAKLTRRAAPRFARRIAARRLRLPLDFGFYLRHALMMDIQLESFRAWHARISQEPPPLDVAAILFRSYEHDADQPASLGWGRCCPRVRVALVRGDHHGMLAPENIRTFCSAFVSGMGLLNP